MSERLNPGALIFFGGQAAANQAAGESTFWQQAGDVEAGGGAHPSDSMQT